MESPLSVNEREALSRFVAKIIEDIDKVAALFEARGADSEAARTAQTKLQYTLKLLAVDPLEAESLAEDASAAETLDEAFQACASDRY